MIVEITNIVNAAKEVVSVVKSIQGLIPNATDREEVLKKIEAAEKTLALAEASTAKDLGYELCLCTFPPQIMLLVSPQEYACKQCGNKISHKTTIFTF
jgi:hypothetical protein